MPLRARDTVEKDAALAHRMLADDRAQQTGLAHTIAAKHAGDFSRFGPQRNSAQGLRCPVVKIDIADFEHDHRPRYTSTTRSLVDT